jgi:hypothetical protein
MSERERLKIKRTTTLCKNALKRILHQPLDYAKNRTKIFHHSH